MGVHMGRVPMGVLMGGLPMGVMGMDMHPFHQPVLRIQIRCQRYECAHCGAVFDSEQELRANPRDHNSSCPVRNRRSSSPESSASHATSNTKRLYHQTSRSAADNIMREQRFARGDSGLAGGGIYFAESPDETEAKAHQHGPVLAADVSLGRIKHIHGGDSSITYSSLQSEGYDSVCILGRSSGKEYVVYNYGQVNNIREY